MRKEVNKIIEKYKLIPIEYRKKHEKSDDVKDFKTI